MYFATLWSYLQGMETWSFGEKTNASTQALILPTRDGNSSTLLIFVYIFSALWSYLQGMETSELFFSLFDYSGFDPIYKGWKLRNNGFISFNLHQALILPTRDGNILISTGCSPQTLALILPTRDGNRSHLLEEIPYDPALILPTRDGNRCSKIGFNFSLALWSYLQGMETFIVIDGDTHFARALILPTRDGNHTKRFSLLMDTDALILPTRDGN